MVKQNILSHFKKPYNFFDHSQLQTKVDILPGKKLSGGGSWWKGDLIYTFLNSGLTFKIKQKERL